MTVTVYPSTLLRASAAAARSAGFHHRAVGFGLAGDIVHGRPPIVTGFERRHAWAARADSLESEQLYQEYVALRDEERAA